MNASQYEAVFRDAADPIILEDLDGFIVDLNAAAQRLYGWTREELMGRSIKEIVPLPAHKNVDGLFAKCKAGEEVRDVEGLRTTKSGAILEVLVTLSLLKDENGQPTGIVSFAKDIRALREKEREAKQLNRVFRDAADPIILEDLDGTIVELNDAAQRLYGWSREELVGKSIKEIIPADSHANADAMLTRCKSGADLRDVQGLRKTKSGQVLEVLVTLSLLKDDLGQATGIVSFAKDISALRDKEKEARQLNRVFRDAADPIILEDLDGIIVDLNESAERLYGWSRQELIGRPMHFLAPEENHARARELFQQCKSGHEVRDVEARRLTKGGEKLPILLTLSLLKDDDGEATQVASYAKEISAQKQAEAQLRELADDLEVRVRERTREFEEANTRLEHELAVARELSRAADREHEAVLLGDSIPIQSLRQSIEAYAKTDETMLLVGPPGAGQEAVARALHRASDRATRPFIFVDATAAGTVESSLFSTQLDAAGERIPGKAALADGGTLYLQGVERLSPETQASLIEFLRASSKSREQGQVPEPDIKLVAFTSSNLSDEIRQGRFDPELERSIGRHRLTIPSLAERRDDILTIADRMATLRSRSIGKVLDGLTDEAGERLLGYSWPGNVEELQNVIERATVLADGTRLDIPAELLQEGPQVGGYSLVRKLGAGAMGEVWFANHALLARPAAVKFIRRQSSEHELKSVDQMRKRFQREARATASLRSQNTVELYDFGVSDEGNFYYVMEYLEGIDLQNLVEKFGALPPARAIHLLTQACLSLAEAHEAGLVHRDIKAANLFACKLGVACDVAKVLDFGIVRETNNQEHMVTATGQLSGTPASMSPEVAAGTPAGPGADIYGLGCVAYWLLTAKPVFEGQNLMQLFMQLANKTPVAPSEHVAEIPVQLDALVLQCLAKKPEDRPASALELRQMLLEVSVDDTWDNEAARQWWNEHSPQSQPNQEQARPISTDNAETMQW